MAFAQIPIKIFQTVKANDSVHQTNLEYYKSAENVDRVVKEKPDFFYVRKTFFLFFLERSRKKKLIQIIMISRWAQNVNEDQAWCKRLRTENQHKKIKKKERNAKRYDMRAHVETSCWGIMEFYNSIKYRLLLFRVNSLHISTKYILWVFLYKSSWEWH